MGQRSCSCAEDIVGSGIPASFVVGADAGADAGMKCTAGLDRALEDGNANLEAVEAVNFQGRESARPFWGGWGGRAGAVVVVAVGGGRLLVGSSPVEGVWSRLSGRRIMVATRWACEWEVDFWLDREREQLCSE